MSAYPCETCATGVARDSARQCLACRDREADADAHIDAQQRMAARRALADADRELDAADRLLSVATAAGWLQRQGVSAPATTVRYWVKRGHLPSQRTSRGHLVVSVSTLRAFAAHLQQCPFHLHRAGETVTVQDVVPAVTCPVSR